MRAFYNCCFADPFVKVAQQLSATHGLDPVYWIGYADDHSEQIIPKLFPDAIFHKYYDAWKGRFPEEYWQSYVGTALDTAFLRRIAEYELQALRIMDRMDPDGHCFSFSERRDLFRKMLRYWTVMLDQLKPDIVISAVIPHRSFDYALYLLCRERRIKWVSFSTTSFLGRLLPLTNIYTNEPELREVYETYRDSDTLGFALDEDIEERLSRVQASYDEASPWYMKRHEQAHRKSATPLRLAVKFAQDLCREPKRYFGPNGFLRQGLDPYWKRRDCPIEKSRYRVPAFSLQRWKQIRALRALRHAHDAVAQAPDLTSPYIYVSLHYQPEAHTSPGGDLFYDQALLIEVLASILPKGWRIYVKENPLQFNPSREGQTNRLIRFYDDITTDPRVVMVPAGTNPFHLIDNAKAVASIAGTVGWEAMVRGKPAIVFGQPWYEHFTDGVLRIYDTADAQRILSFIEGYSFDERKLRAYLRAFQSLSVQAYHYRGYRKRVAHSEEESVQRLVQSIGERL